MTVGLFLMLCEILDNIGGAAEAFITIKKDIAAKGLQIHEPLPDEHLAKVRETLKPALTGFGSWDDNHAGEGS
jgi:hypothetical protein